MDTPTFETTYAPTHTSIAQRLAALAEAEQRVTELRESLRQDYEALREALPRTRTRKAAQPAKVKRGRKSKAAAEFSEPDSRDN